MITQSEYYRLFQQIDRIPQIMEPRLGPWRAWPIAKMHLVWFLAYQGTELSAERTASRRVKERVSHYLSDLALWARQSRRKPGNGGVGMIYVPRLHRFADGSIRDMIYGDLLRGDGLDLPAVPLEQPFHSSSRQVSLPERPVYLRPYHSAAELLALALMSTSRLRTIADQLDAVLEDAGFPVASKVRRSKILVALGLFEARRRVFRHVLRRLGLRALVVTYAPGCFGEIAAAHELKIPVLELQHGFVGAHCPEYAWPDEYRTMKSEIAVPDRIGLFGPMFAREIVRSGFWAETEASAIGAAWLERYRPSALPRQANHGRLRLLFMTQPTSRAAAIAFWQGFLASAQNAPEFELAIKLHPEETNDAPAYQVLERTAPGRISVMAAAENPIEAMLKVDVVLSYNSMSLIEALGIGRPSISLCGGSIPGGLAGTFNLQGITGVMPHVRSPEQLHQTLRERAGSGDALERWREQALNQGRDCFAEGFSDAATKIINEMAASAK